MTSQLDYYKKKLEGAVDNIVLEKVKIELKEKMILGEEQEGLDDGTGASQFFLAHLSSYNLYYSQSFQESGIAPQAVSAEQILMIIESRRGK